MTLLTAIKNNDCDALRASLGSTLDAWSHGLANNSQMFDNAEELFAFFLLDMLTSLSYSLQADTEVMKGMVGYMKTVITNIECNIS